MLACSELSEILQEAVSWQARFTGLFDATLSLGVGLFYTKA